MKTWKIYLIHHSHTDIGYTERQEKMKVNHRDYILQALDILDDLHAGKMIGYEGFTWQCENHWQVENFYAHAKTEDIERFEMYVRSGGIGLSGHYLNMTELIDEDTLLSRTMKAKTYGDTVGVPVTSGMSADINGYAWGYPDILSRCDVHNLFSAVHSHHGLAPLGKNQQPFYWEGPQGGKVLVWLGEHYHLGNDFHLCPQGGANYLIQDDIRSEYAAGHRTSTSEETKAQELKIAETRIRRYAESLEKDGYPYEFFPVMVSGVISDNAPPNAEIARRVNDLNDIFDGEIIIKMCSLDTFFDAVRSADHQVPTYRGDWPDWWADGVGSTPNTLKLYRDAQRKLSLAKKLDPEGELGDPDLLERASENIMLYAEHTWGYSSSVSEPWDSMVAGLEKRKDAYAINADIEASTNLDQTLVALGEVPISPKRNQRYTVINPHKVPYYGIVKLYIEHWEYLDGIKLRKDATLLAINEESGEMLPCQGRSLARAYEVDVVIALHPGESKTIKLKQDLTNTRTIPRAITTGAEGVADVVLPGPYLETPMLVETDFFKVTFSQEKGIAEILDKRSGRVITSDTVSEGAFSGIYEFTPSREPVPTEVRRAMGRNRSAMSTERSVAKLKDISIEESGPVSVTAKLTYELTGTRFYIVFLKVHKLMSVIEVKVCLHKDSVWEPENLYVSLPFKGDTPVATYIDKTGCVVRPGMDQLPGTGQDYYLLQNGVFNIGENVDVLIATKDAPLVAFGERLAKPIELYDGKISQRNNEPAYSWVMNNFWETNFKADLGGFYEFRYTVVADTFESPEFALEYAKVMNEGVVGFAISEPEVTEEPETVPVPKPKTERRRRRNGRKKRYD